MIVTTTAGGSMSSAEFPVTLKGSLLILSQLSSCGPRRRRSIFLPRSAADPCNKWPWGLLSASDTFFIFADTPAKRGLEGDELVWKQASTTGSALCSPLVIVVRWWCRAEESPDIPRVSHYPAVYHDQLHKTGAQSAFPLLPHISRTGSWTHAKRQRRRQWRGEERWTQMRDDVWWGFKPNICGFFSSYCNIGWCTTN